MQKAGGSNPPGPMVFSMKIADLHVHTKYSRATSKNMDLEELAKFAKIKGIDILGTGDFTHPLWLKELKDKLGPGMCFNDISFVLSGEISLIYKQGGKCRRVHHLILAPSFDVVDQMNEFFDKKGRRDYDGRPIFGFSSIELAEEMMSISKDIEIIPAHAWTPWYGIFGSMSGFDSLKECFAEKTKYIHAIETGMSSNPEMNWRVSFLDNISLISNSDAHSAWPWRLGREANVFDFEEMNYSNLVNALRSRKSFAYTLEVNPNYGKYHLDGHRLCNFSCYPKESKNVGDSCPKCGKPLIKGVLNRVEELADRQEGFTPKEAVPFCSPIPLSELISAFTGNDVFTKKVWQIYNLLINRFGNEFDVLLKAEQNELQKIIDARLAELIIRNRENKLMIEPGYDGVYGRLIVNEKEKIID